MANHNSSFETDQALEFEGKTVDLAIKSAAQHFQTDPEELEIEIVTRGSTGIFGLGGRNAIIRAKPKAIPAEPETVEGAATGATGEERGDVLNLAADVAARLLEHAGLHGEVTVAETEDGPCLDISGEDLALIIGKEGQTLDALEYLVNRMTCRKLDRHVRIVVDACGYRRKREESLVQLALRKADKAKKLGRPVTLSRMEPRERRIVHMALMEISGVRTYSVGRGGLRKVVIAPLRKAESERRKRNHSSKR